MLGLKLFMVVSWAIVAFIKSTFDSWSCYSSNLGHLKVLVFDYDSSIRKNGGRYAEGNFKCIFVNEKIWILLNLFTEVFFPEGPINTKPYCLRKWLGTEQVTSHYLNQWWFHSLIHKCVSGPQWVMTVHSEQYLLQVPRKQACFKRAGRMPHDLQLDLEQKSP